MHRHWLSTPILVIAGALGASPAASAAQESAGLEAIDFMVGCWEQSRENGLREYYAPPAQNMMTGLSQFWRDGRIVDWEFHRIDAGPEGPVLTPHPRGVASVSFDPVVLEPGRVVWENLEHDFPNRISYQSVPGDSLVVEADGGEGADARTLTWRMARVACPAG